MQTITKEKLFFSAQLKPNNLNVKHFYDGYDNICGQKG